MSTLSIENQSSSTFSDFKNKTVSIKETDVSTSSSITKNNSTSKVQRRLKSRHVSMIALGGTIGTGLFISISDPLQQAGPAGALLSMAAVGLIAYSVSQSLGEMTTFIPVTSSFAVFTKRFISPAVGSAVGYCYLLSYSIAIALELSVVASIVDYWNSTLTVAEWNIIVWVLIILLNMMPVGVYGEVEFWFSSIKVISIFGFLIFSLCMVCGAKEVGGHKPIGFHYWKNPGAFGSGIISSNKGEAQFLGFVNSLVAAAFSLEGIEICAISAGEAKNPQKTIKKAINKAFFRIILFYIGSLFFIGMLVPYNDPKYNNTKNFISDSPFLLAIENCNVKVLPSIFNAIILSTIISTANSDLYIGSRVLYGLAMEKQAPKIFTKTTKNGTPIYAVALISLFGFLAFLECSVSGKEVFNWLLNCTTCFCAPAWIFISFSHVRFRNILKHRGMTVSDLPFVSRFVGPKTIGPLLAGIAMTLIVIIQGFTSFCPWNYQTFLADYVSVFIFFALWAGFHLYYCITLVSINDFDENRDLKIKGSKTFKVFNKVCVFQWKPLFLSLDETDIESDRIELYEELWENNGSEGQFASDKIDYPNKKVEEEISFITLLSKTRKAPKGKKVSIFFKNFWECICNCIS